MLNFYSHYSLQSSDENKTSGIISNLIQKQTLTSPSTNIVDQSEEDSINQSIALEKSSQEVDANELRIFSSKFMKK